MKIKLDEVSPALRKRIEAQLNQGPAGIQIKTEAPTITAITLMAQISPTYDVSMLNKTEAKYLDYLKSLNPQWLGVQCIKLKLAKNTTYTPDFWAIDHLGVLHAREVKGFWRDDARVKIKVAARMYPWVRFTAATLVKQRWQHEEIKP